MFDLIHLLLLATFVTLAIYLWRGRSVYDIALRAARAHCRRLGLQFLDDSVSLARIRVKRDRGGHLRLWRTYQFEFTATGGERYSGRVFVHGHVVEGIQMPPYRVESTFTLH